MNDYDLTVNVFPTGDEWIYSVIQEIDGEPEVLGHGRADSFEQAKEFVIDTVRNLR